MVAAVKLEMSASWLAKQILIVLILIPELRDTDAFVIKAIKVNHILIQAVKVKTFTIKIFSILLYITIWFILIFYSIITDINECEDPNSNLCKGICTNTPRSYSCSCKDGYVVDEFSNGWGCLPQTSEFLVIKFSLGN